MSIKEKGPHLSASIRKLAASLDLDVNEIRVIVALERIVARLSTSDELSGSLVFKGGFTLLKTASSRRFTRDLDALVTHAPRESIKLKIIDALTTDLDDGLWFGDVQTSDLPDHGEYEGIRYSVAYQIGEIPDPRKLHKLSRVHFDIAFGDILPLGADERSMQSILPAFSDVPWKVYPLTSIVAEKLQTLVRRGSLNSRAKDCYDLVLLLDMISLNNVFSQVLIDTFNHRGTELPSSFAEMFQALDLTFLRSAWPSVSLTDEGMSFEECCQKLILLLRRVDTALKEASSAH